MNSDQAHKQIAAWSKTACDAWLLDQKQAD